MPEVTTDYAAMARDAVIDYPDTSWRENGTKWIAALDRALRYARARGATSACICSRERGIGPIRCPHDVELDAIEKEISEVATGKEVT